MSMKDVVGEVTKEMRADPASIAGIDQDELRRRIYERANTYTQQGIPVEGFDPKLTPPDRPAPPPKPAAPPEQPSFLSRFNPFASSDTPTTTPPSSTTSTTLQAPGPTATSASGLPPELSFLDAVPLTLPEQHAQVGQLVQAMKQGTPMQQLVNWGHAIADMPNQQALPR
jgi:hypothetical protein